MNIYKNQGYENKAQYLDELSDMYGVDIETVTYLSEILGDNEAFDGLVTQLDDMQQGW